MATVILSPEDYTTILQNRFKTQDVKYISAEYKSISENIEGFLGEHYNLHITYQIGDETNTEIFFIKSKPTKNKIQVEMSNEVDVYKKEIFIYDVLFKEYAQRGYDTSFCTLSYHCIPNQSIILENLVHKGYKLAERCVSFDLDKIKCVLKSLALFHGANFAYQLTKSKELNKTFSFAEDYSNFMEESIFSQPPKGMIKKWWEGSYKTFDLLIGLMSKDDKYKNAFKAALKDYPCGKSFTIETNFVKTLGHGDLWSNNMLFKYHNDKPMECRLIDFQITRDFYPSLDIILAIFANTSHELRTKNLTNLYNYYYETLKDVLNNYGYSLESVMPVKDFQESIVLVKPDALLQVLACNSMIYLSRSQLNDSVNKDKLDDLLFNNYNMCEKAFKTNDKYNEIISQSLEDLYNAILEVNSHKL